MFYVTLTVMNGPCTCIAAIASVLAIGCSSSKEPKPRPDPGVVVTLPVPQGGVRCQEAIPDAIVSKYFPTAMASYSRPRDTGDGAFVTSCRFGSEETGVFTNILYLCDPTTTDFDGYVDEFENPSVKYERFADVGRGRFKGGGRMGTLHRSLPCVISAQQMNEKESPIPDFKPLLADLEAALAP
jgi:hypothetical protein